MGIPSPGSIVVIPFPFSDLSVSKLRPAVVIAHSEKGDWILAQITSKSYQDKLAIIVKEQDFKTGGLKLTSYARPGKLFTANQSLFQANLGLIHPEKLNEIITSIFKIINRATFS